jgi:hypothetical protein
MNLDPLYLAIGGFVVIIFLFKRELLVEEESFQLIGAISILLFIAGLVLHFTEAGRYSMSGALLSPLVSLGLFRLCRRIFLRRLNREPRDTFLDWSRGMAADRVFNIVYFILAAWLLMLITIGMEKLAKAGW